MKKHKGLIIFLVILLSLALGAGGGYLYYQNGLKPVSDNSSEIIFTVEDDDTGDQVLARLAEKGMIRNEMVAKLYLRISKMDAFKAGDYKIDSKWTTPEIIEVLNNASLAIPRDKEVTFIEGWWARDFAKQLDENLDITADELLELWNNSSYVSSLANDYWFITPEIFQSEKVLLEGYLFPNTYRFLIKATGDEITRQILDHTKEVLDPYRSQIESSGFTIHELITLASIVQYEGRDAEDMPIIASVFYNRLANGWRLESSVTVCYALYNYSSWQDCEENVGMMSPYNTYVNDGLPPGPILNPGLVALDAVMNPADTNYFFFMADIHGDGAIHFAETWEEHAQNVEQYLGG